MDSKRCSKCGEEKTIEAFRPYVARYGDGRVYNYRRTWCVECTNAWHAESRKTPERKEYQRLYQRERRKSDVVKVYNRGVYLKYHHGITLEDYMEMSRLQGDVCAICGEKQNGSRYGNYLFVDHDHETGEIRGLLCHTCNSGLGYFRDDPDRLIAAAEYMERFINRCEDSANIPNEQTVNN